MKINRVGSCNYHQKPTSLCPPNTSAPTPFLKAAALKFRVIYLQTSFNQCRHTTKEEIIQWKGGSEHDEQREREREKEGRKQEM